MKQTLNTLASFIRKKVKFVQNEENEDAFEGRTFEIYEDGNEELLGVCVFDSSNSLVDLHCVDLYKQGNLTNKDMPEIAKTFIKAFYPRGLKEYMLQSIVDLDDIYLVTYGIKDERYGIDLPGIGFSLTISTSGEVVQFSYDHELVEINYPAQMISEKEAKEKYVSLIDFELIIRQTDTETYVNGDNTYRLAYMLKEAAVDIPASGEDPVVIEEGNQYEQIPQQKEPAASFYEMIGITTDYVKLGEQRDEDVIIEKWIHSSLTWPEEIDFTEAYGEQMITIHFDSETNAPTFIYNGEQWQGEQVQLADDVLQKQALDFLFKIFPQAHEHFFIEIIEVEDEEWIEDIDKEEWQDMDGGDIEEIEGEEESIAFYFQYHVNNVLVEEAVTCIQVGIYSGNIVSASVEPINGTFLEQIGTKAKFSKKEAKEKFKCKLRMELSMAHEYDEEGNPFYHVTYLPSFPETVGHIQMIDAENGKAYYVDIGETVFFNE